MVFGRVVVTWPGFRSLTRVSRLVGGDWLLTWCHDFTCDGPMERCRRPARLPDVRGHDEGGGLARGMSRRILHSGEHPPTSVSGGTFREELHVPGREGRQSPGRARSRPEGPRPRFALW